MDAGGRLKGASVLVTGGLGFIGSGLVHKLVQLGAKVTIMDALIDGHGGLEFNISGLEAHVRVCRRDIRDVDALRDLIPGQDFLFNLAGQTSHVGSMRDPFADLDINARGQLAVMETSRALNPDLKIVFASTRQIYGRPEYLPVDEDHRLCPVDINGIHKLAGESYHRLYHDVYGIRSCILRLTNTYGPRMRIRDGAQTFVGVWIRAILEGREFEVWGGNQLRDFTFVDDAVDALILAAERDEADGKVFNLGGEALELRSLAEALVRVHGSGSYVVKDFPAARAPIEIGDFRSDYSAIAGALGWTSRTGIEAGLARTLGYFAENIAHYV